MLYFIDSELQRQQQDLLSAGITRDKFLRYLEADYSKRVVEDYSGEQGLFGQVSSTLSLAEQVQAKAQLNHIFDTEIPAMIEDKTVMDEIDQEIKQITDSEANLSTKGKNLKSRSDEHEY